MGPVGVAVAVPAPRRLPPEASPPKAWAPEPAPPQEEENASPEEGNNDTAMYIVLVTLAIIPFLLNKRFVRCVKKSLGGKSNAVDGRGGADRPAHNEGIVPEVRE